MTALVAIALVVACTLAVGAFGVRRARSSSSFLVASRRVRPALNAVAICGEYLSAGSYLGLAGLVVVFGLDILWLPLGWTAGYLFLLLFVAAPLRRFGAYTIPEFAEGRLASPALRRLASLFVLVISWLYLLPQMKGAGIVLRELVGAPYALGVVLIGLVAVTSLTGGGMRSITYVQGFQFVVVAFGVLVPLFFVLASGAGQPFDAEEGVPRYAEATRVDYPTDVVVEVVEPTWVQREPQARPGGGRGAGVEGRVRLEPGIVPVDAGTTLVWPAGAAVAHVDDVQPLRADRWAVPFAGRDDLAGGHPVYFAYATLMAAALGTMGLPHVLARFYTNTDGRAARRTTVWVLAMLGPYYALIVLYGLLARTSVPEVLSNATTDVTTLALVDRLVSGPAGRLTSAVLAAGAVAAMLSTSSGLLIALASTASHDLGVGGVRRFRQAAWLGALVAVLLGLLAASFDISVLVAWAFAVAASSFCPLLVLGIWWRGLTARGAFAGMALGGGCATASVVVAMLGLTPDGWPAALTSSPAAWTVPLAFVAAVAVSLLDADGPRDVDRSMALMHVPDTRAVLAD